MDYSSIAFNAVLGAGVGVLAGALLLVSSSLAALSILFFCLTVLFTEGALDASLLRKRGLLRMLVYLDDLAVRGVFNILGGLLMMQFGIVAILAGVILAVAGLRYLMQAAALQAASRSFHGNSSSEPLLSKV